MIPYFAAGMVCWQRAESQGCLHRSRAALTAISNVSLLVITVRAIQNYVCIKLRSISLATGIQSIHVR